MVRRCSTGATACKMWTTLAFTNPACLPTISAHSCVRKGVQTAWPSRRRHQVSGLKRDSRPHFKVVPGTMGPST
eukprot:6111700-Pyramimonas_sp.AAC.1